MTMIHVFLLGSHLVAVGAGAYGWYRWGTVLKADAAKVKSVV
jgi:hypothetical protein